jgi:hypothetical protein
MRRPRTTVAALGLSAAALVALVLHEGYLLTPQGIAEKVALTSRFLKRKMEEYEALKNEIENLKADFESIENIKINSKR